MIERARQVVEARRKAKLEEAERVAASVESERIRREGVEARRKALVAADKVSDVTNSPPPEKYLGLDKSAQENYHSKMDDYKGRNRRVSPTPDHFENYNAARDTYLSDGQLGAMALEAWRSHLRKMHEYLPDRDIPKATHLDHLKVLSSALTDFKRQWTALNLWGEGAVSYKHERYALICQKYHIPPEVCCPKELMRSVERKEMNTLYRKRCCQLNKFYSMLLKDTPQPRIIKKRGRNRGQQDQNLHLLLERTQPSIPWREEQTPISGWARHLSWTCLSQRPVATLSPRTSQHGTRRTCTGI